ncbi:hypothetical protein LX36DRAFT_206070 [Colletotrichum falcatum]|nr:hypothetical protein LX36DRAFT_206070 [Colletotrichum falcatum]
MPMLRLPSLKTTSSSKACRADYQEAWSARPRGHRSTTAGRWPLRMHCFSEAMVAPGARTHILPPPPPPPPLSLSR